MACTPDNMPITEHAVQDSSIHITYELKVHDPELKRVHGITASTQPMPYKKAKKTLKLWMLKAEECRSALGQSKFACVVTRYLLGYADLAPAKSSVHV